MASQHHELSAGEAVQPPSPETMCALVQAELALPLATVRLGLEGLRASRIESPHTQAAGEALADLEAMLLGVVSLAFELTPALPQERIDLAAVIRQALAAAAEGSEERVQARIDGTLSGSFSVWACRRVVHELTTFALALTVAPIAVTARACGAAVRLEMQVPGVRPSSLPDQPLARDLGSAPGQFQLWLAARLMESAGGGLEIGPGADGGLCLVATWPGLREEQR